MKIAFVQDAMLFQGGADKVVAAALEVFPQAPIYTLFYKPEAYKGTVFENHPIHSSLLNYLPAAHKVHRLYLPLMPLALAQFDLSHFDVVVAFSYAVAHNIATRPDQLHISYMHTPMRYAWRPGQISQISPGTRSLPYRMAAPWLSLFRGWDQRAASRTDYFLTNSRYTADLIWQAYHRQAEVIYPPVDTISYRPRQPRENYYVAVSRLVGHKRLDLVVKAFSELDRHLIVVGDGPEMDHLRAAASSNVQFLGWQPQERLAGLLGTAKAFVHAGEEDFGIAIAEAQAAGCPVITIKSGAASEIVEDGASGLLFANQSVGSLIEAIKRFERQGVSGSPEDIQQGAQRFNRAAFTQTFEKIVKERWLEFSEPRSITDAQIPAALDIKREVIERV